jgi:TonB family protein
MIARAGAIADPGEKEKEKGKEKEKENIKKVTGGVLQGHAIYRQEPRYPTEANRHHFGGTVIVLVTVDESGKVIHAEATCGPTIFREGSVEAARKWRFTPTKLYDVPVKVIGTITFHFNP